MKKVFKYISTFLYNLLLSIPLTLVTATALLAYSTTVDIPGCVSGLCRLDALNIPVKGTPISFIIYLVILNILKFVGGDLNGEDKSKFKLVLSKIYVVMEFVSLVLSAIIVILFVYIVVRGYMQLA